MWAPSCIASAEVALHELNAENGIRGRPVEITIVDSAIEAEIPAEIRVDAMIRQGRVDALVGMHISDVRQRIAETVRGRVPFVYTPLYEGGEASPWVYAIGDTPAGQLGPAISHMSRRFKLRKWAMVGNDYIWPRVSHAHAKLQLRRQHGDVVFDAYLPFSSDRLAEAVETIGRSGADAVLISLVGQDAVDFNRLFGALDLHRRMFRLSCAVEENGLLASGARNVHRLFSSASYFAGLDTPANASFRELYHNFHKNRAPMLNAMGQSTYEGLHFLASLVAGGGEDWRVYGTGTAPPVTYRSARRGLYMSNAQNPAPVYIARADGYVFDELQRLG